jgi:hypothetical protein
MGWGAGNWRTPLHKPKQAHGVDAREIRHHQGKHHPAYAYVAAAQRKSASVSPAILNVVAVAFVV